ncbi:GNAT family N-acetyltransferase [Pseudomonas nitroreducens]|uniref:GNAT family N-acetyltransferase n=1 Tax=Pseudomonas nitroreducens TaxID=46680 RepID=UPI001E2E4F1F|nr:MULTISPECIES: GNAT family N-acetyltransferase [Pseudomonas]MCE4070584.1 GNAT family N-acetyltransferase [Pseudomonas nitritireducens]MCE4080546.1 GNAT family N-acetyltransferase [Pseudomonas nitroreducens]
MKKPLPRKYPHSLTLDGALVELRLMSADDGPALTDFIGRLPVHDLLFVRRNISHPRVISAWLAALGERITSLVAVAGGEIVGCSAVVTDALSWSPHVGDLRILVKPSWRGCGLGRVLTEESFAQALAQGLEKLTVQMTVDQSAAIAVFEDLGFRPESVLRNHVKDHDGKTYDLALLSLEVSQLHLRSRARGMSSALNE